MYIIPYKEYECWEDFNTSQEEEQEVLLHTMVYNTCLNSPSNSVLNVVLASGTYLPLLYLVVDDVGLLIESSSRSS